MLRCIAQKFTFPALLGLAATYGLAAPLAVLLLADGVARTSAYWPNLRYGHFRELDPYKTDYPASAAHTAAVCSGMVEESDCANRAGEWLARF